MKKRLVCALAVLAVLLAPGPALAWNATGHDLVARIAWDHMTPTARRNAVRLLRAAPQDACLLDLFPEDARPLAEREREFFVRVSEWPDIVRPKDRDDTRPCIRFHRRDWHFINFFWEGVSDATGSAAPRVRTDVATPELNAVERLSLLRPFVVCAAPQCGTERWERATRLAWILHIVGDLHQPLHTSARITTEPDEQRGDQGGNLFKIGPAPDPPSLHGYWDGIVNRSVPEQPGEAPMVYVDRVAKLVEAAHPFSRMRARIRPGEYEAWAREGFTTTMNEVYPESLVRGRMPDDAYRAKAFAISEEAIALAGYRLADLLNRMLGS